MELCGCDGFLETQERRLAEKVTRVLAQETGLRDFEFRI